VARGTDGPDFVGFAIEVKSPGSPDFSFLRNRLAFSYPPDQPPDGFKYFPTSESPLQTFRWIHFPQDPKPGAYRYRVTMMHMAADGILSAGFSTKGKITLFDETIPGILDIGFTRNIASSQAFVEKFPKVADRKRILPANADDGLSFDKSKAPAGVYDWLGGKANALLDQVLDTAVADPAVTLDVMAFDLNEPGFFGKLETVARRGTAAIPALRILIDNSDDHKPATCAESIAAAQLITAGASVVRHSFHGLQHNKVVILRRNGKAQLAVGGSTNFSYRGLFIQANNMLVYKAPEAVDLFQKAFEIAFAGKKAWDANPFHSVWHVLSPDAGTTQRLCFSPHKRESDLSLSPVAGAVEQATSSVLFAVAFLNQDTKGPVRKALDRLTLKPLFSYGIANRDTGLELTKPDGSIGVVDFQALADNAPVPFTGEWSGGPGITIHHKFIVTDFNLPTAKVFAGSSNLSFSGEEGNGDHLVQISDSRVATAYAVEALRMFDHLHFRNKLAEDAAKLLAKLPAKPKVKPPPIALKKPPGPGETAWFARAYQPDTQKFRDRLLFGV
jgi:phosphatidylserine/phosphatidylglycerophosphate/cardiolipin synthase-like enzyme